MDSDYKEEDQQIFSDDEDSKLQHHTDEPWQCGLLSRCDRILALHEKYDFTDITLTFPGWEVIYDAHRLILAISSPVFAGILYGPLRTEGRNVLLHGDDPLAMEYVIAHCYGYDLDAPDMETVLGVYKLADKYILECLKKECYQYIVDTLDQENNNKVIEFAEKFNFVDLKSNCLLLLKEFCKEALDRYEYDEFYEDEPDSTSVFDILINFSDPWIEGLFSEFVISQVCVRALDFQESWKYPEIPLENNRIRTILSSKGVCYLDKFYGCINAECIKQFPLVPIPEDIFSNDSHICSVLEPDPYLASKPFRYVHNTVEALELCLSVTDLHHAKRVIETINDQKRFESNLIALHIRCEKDWPNNWSPIPLERTHRPSLLLLSDADDDSYLWIIEASKAFLPQCEGSYNTVFKQGNNIVLTPVNILFLPRSNLTIAGFVNLILELSTSGVKCTSIIFQSPNIEMAHQDIIDRCSSILEGCGLYTSLEMVHEDYNMFREVFEFIPKINI